MQQPVEQKRQNRAFVSLIAVGVILAIVGVGIQIANKHQQADPTFTKAPPPGPNAQILHPSAAKMANGGSLNGMKMMQASGTK